MPVEFWSDAERVAADRFRPWFDLGPELTIGTHVVPSAAHGVGGFIAKSNRSSPAGQGMAIYTLPADILAALADGEQPAEVGYTVVLDRGGHRAKADHVIKARWKLLPADTPSTDVDTDPAAWQAIERGLSVRYVNVETGPGPVRSGLVTTWPDFPKGTPTPLALELSIRKSGQEWPVAQFLFRPSMSSCQWWGLPADQCPPLLDGRVDVVVRPSTAAAAQTVDVTRIWGGPEIVRKDVPVTRLSSGPARGGR